MSNGRDFGTLSIQEVCFRARYSASNKDKELGLVGDQKTLERFMEHREKFRSVQLTNNTVMGYALAGDYVDVDRYLSGEPECMVDYSSYESARFVDVSIYVGRPWFTPDFIVFEYYSHVLDMLDKLESEGCRCKITLNGRWVHHHISGNPETTFQIPYKGYGENLNMAQLAGILLNNDFFSNVMIGAFGVGECMMYDSRSMRSVELRQTEEAITIPSLYWFLGMESRRFCSGWNKNWSKDGTFFYPVFERNFVFKEWGLSHLIAD